MQFLELVCNGQKKVDITSLSQIFIKVQLALDEAANKGQALSNYYAAIQGLGTAAAGTTRQANMIDSDKMIQAMNRKHFLLVHR